MMVEDNADVIVYILDMETQFLRGSNLLNQFAK